MSRSNTSSPTVQLNFSQSNTLEVSYSRIQWLKAKISQNNEEYAALKKSSFRSSQDIIRMKSLNEEMVKLLKEKTGRI